ncbi:hypothetical protein [Deinococcus sedimenti]|uniref:EF-hand domain-containing protein n=1 Tax=Deinococcus sedimenti TaxID=1867090 RepID=A0ABQ2SBZ1_9DEIO|nr:hypothetical protein [Deinococcus sedimenti]GGS11456.1 hypothetical protein GCM10008960_41750 [Deinococcus sedimenti]
MTVARMALCAALLGSASAQGERLLYSHDLPPSRGTVAPEHAPLLTVAKLNAQVGGCDNTSVRVLAARTGAFVTPGQRDALYLYDSSCDDSVRFVLIRGMRALYSGLLAQPNSMARFVEAYVLRDINQDGREEFVTVFEIAASSAGLQWLTVWNPATLPRTGRITRADTVLVSRTWCDLADSGPAGTLWHWNIFVKPGPTPTLSADAFRADSCRDGAPFRPTGRRGPAPRPDPELLKDFYR